MSSVLVVDDHELFRKGLIAALNEVAAGIDWLEAGSLRETLALLAARGPVSLVVLDLKLPDTQGFGALSALRQAYPQQRVLVISASADDTIHHQVLALGAWGFAGKSATTASLRDLLVSALSLATHRADQNVSDPAYVRAARDNPVGYAHVQRLGERHLRILELLLRGCSNHQIVTETGLALGTVKNYVSAVLICFEARSRAHLLSLFK